jgi:hypothetical protein
VWCNVKCILYQSCVLFITPLLSDTQSVLSDTLHCDSQVGVLEYCCIRPQSTVFDLYCVRS